MGFPSTGLESTYRNPLAEVKRFFEKKLRGASKVYNLCVEQDRQYPKGTFEKMVTYGFHDHNPPPLKMMEVCCTDIVDI